MGPIMKTASMKPEVALLDNEELNGIDNDADDWQFVSLGEQQNFGIKTAGLEDKATACQMLVCSGYIPFFDREQSSKVLKEALLLLLFLLAGNHSETNKKCSQWNKNVLGTELWH